MEVTTGIESGNQKYKAILIFEENQFPRVDFFVNGRYEDTAFWYDYGIDRRKLLSFPIRVIDILDEKLENRLNSLSVTEIRKCIKENHNKFTELALGDALVDFVKLGDLSFLKMGENPGWIIFMIDFPCGFSEEWEFKLNKISENEFNWDCFGRY